MQNISRSTFPSIAGEIKRLGLALAVVASCVCLAGCASIHEAAVGGDLQRVTILVQSAPSLVNTRNQQNATPLHVAANYDKISVVEYLLSKGADPRAVDECGFTALHFASCSPYWGRLRNGGANIIRALVKAGADVNARRDHGTEQGQVNS